MMRQTVGLSFSSLQQDEMFTQLTCQPGFCVCVWVQPLFLQGWIRLNDPSSSHCRSALFGPFLLGFTGQPVPRQHCGGSEGVLGYRAVDMEMN